MPTSRKRAAYLAGACSGDAKLRRQVDALLAAHDKSGEFLDVPALEQMAGGETSEQGLPGADVDISFLQPSTTPGSLGRLGSYEIRELLGRGGCGIVFKAFDDRLNRPVAIKVLSPELAATSPARKRFVREAQAAAAIRHEHVVAIHDVGKEPIPFLVMEYIAGQTLQQHLDTKGPLDTAEVVRIGRQIALGMQAAHAIGLVHRDIKPGNVLVESGSERVKLTDFGLARAGDDASLTQSGTIAGTPLYMSPEQASGDTIDSRSDLFSLGSVLYVMVTGRPPFRASTTLAVLNRVANEEPRPIEEIIPETPEWLIAVIGKLHAKKPDDRYATAQEVADVLAEGFAGPQVKRKAVKRPVTVAPVQRSGGRWMAAAVVLGALAGVAVTESTGVTNLRGAIGRLMTPERALVAVVAPPQNAVDPKHAVAVAVVVPEPELAIAPFDAKLAAKHQQAWVDYLKQPVVEKSRTGVEMVLIPPGGGKMSQPWRLGKYEVTQAQFLRVMGFNPSRFQSYVQGADPRALPVENVRWYVAVEFCNEVSKLEKLKPYYEIKVDKREGDEIVEAEVKILGGDGYRLPSAMEWEYACRAGSHLRFGYSDREEDLDRYGWYGKNNEGRTHNVGEKLPNGFGLHDVYGNVNEWCWDLATLPTEPVLRVNLGGGWSNAVDWASSGIRRAAPPVFRQDNMGFRLARGPLQAEPDAKQAAAIRVEPKKTDVASAVVGPEPDFAIAPFEANLAAKHQQAWADYLKQPVTEKSRPLGIEMVVIPPGNCKMTQPWRLGKYEVTQAQFMQVMGWNPSRCQAHLAKGADPRTLPVENIRQVRGDRILQ